jgi:hypothetical protein
MSLAFALAVMYQNCSGRFQSIGPLNQSHSDGSTGVPSTNPDEGPLFGFVIASTLNAPGSTPEERCQAPGSSWGAPMFLNGVRSLIYPDGGDCYDSTQADTWEYQAKYLHAIGADFVIADLTNIAKSQMPDSNPEWANLNAVVEGFDNYKGKHLKVTPMISMTSYAHFDHGHCVGNNGITETSEILTVSAFMKAHITEIADLVGRRPGSFLQHEGKPLILVYLNSGHNVKNCDGSYAFEGPYHLIPSEQQMQQIDEMKLNGQPLSDRFTVRFVLVPSNVGPADLSTVDKRIWPFANNYGDKKYAEASWLSLQMGAPQEHRSFSHFDALHARQGNRDFYIVNCWSYYASLGDELMDQSCTIEPNTMLSHVDESSNPWEYFEKVQQFIWSKKSGDPPYVEKYSLSEAQDRNLVNLTFVNSMSDLLRDHVTRASTGIECVKLEEPADTEGTWHDNYICHKPAVTGVSISWSYMGPIPGQHCVAFNEPSDAVGTWYDNYLCFNRPVDLHFSNAGRSNKYCIRIFEPADPDTWDDNYLCSSQKFFVGL